MRALLRPVALLGLAAGLAGCAYEVPGPYGAYYGPGYGSYAYTPAPAVGDALIGAGAGAALGGIAGGGSGAAIGALAGGALGAAVGASNAPPGYAYGYGYPGYGYGYPAPGYYYGY